MIYYRSAQSTDLTAGQVDANFRTLEEAILAASAGGATIVDVVVEGSEIEFVFSDGSTIGPFVLPGGVPEAPADGQAYARSNRTWTVVTSAGGGGISHAPADGAYYASKDGAWATIQPGFADVPNDNVSYVRRNKGWVAAASGSGGVRHLGDWNAQLAVQKYDLVERNDLTWMARDTYGPGTSVPAPSLAATGYWLPLGLPSPDFTEAVSDRLRHQFQTPNRVQKMTLQAILNEFQTRLEALEAAFA